MYKTLLLLALALFNTGQPSPEKPKTFDTTYIDSTVRPHDDFYQFANGSWMKNNPVPEGETRWGSFNEVSLRNNEILIKILKDAANNTNAVKGSIDQLLGDYYYSITNYTKRNGDRIKPIQPELDQIKAITKDQFAGFIASLHQKGINPLFELAVNEDLKNNTKNALYLSQPTLGLPDKDYYSIEENSGGDYQTARDMYTEYITRLFQLGELDAIDAGKITLKVETTLSEKMMTGQEMVNIDVQYNVYSYTDFKKLCPKFEWDQYFQSIGTKAPDSLVISQPEYFRALNETLSSIKLKDWKTYFTAEVLNANSTYLTHDFEMANFDFYHGYLRGKKSMLPEDRRAILAMVGPIGDVLGQAFVEKQFDKKSIQKLTEIVNNLQAAFAERMVNYDWMTEETKAIALKKLNGLSKKLVAPDRTKNLSDLKIDRGSYARNSMNNQGYSFREMLKKLGQPVANSEWAMAAHVVNAYYNPVQNEICFPAGILQPPFFDPKAEDAVNYGRIGAVIAHEITHGYDEAGSQFDASGNFSSWWSEGEVEAYQAKIAPLVTQFNAYQPIAGDTETKVNGSMTLSENVADLGGVIIAYHAYQKSLIGKSRDNIDGYTPEQRFFISFAQVWKSNATEKYLMTQVHTDPHAPTKFRVNGTLSNVPEFYQAFNIKPGDPMFKAEITSIW